MALTHFNEEGRARMVDVSAKNITVRTARAGGTTDSGLSSRPSLQCSFVQASAFS